MVQCVPTVLVFFFLDKLFLLCANLSVFQQRSIEIVCGRHQLIFTCSALQACIDHTPGSDRTVVTLSCLNEIITWKASYPNRCAQAQGYTVTAPSAACVSHCNLKDATIAPMVHPCYCISDAMLKLFIWY